MTCSLYFLRKSGEEQKYKKKIVFDHVTLIEVKFMSVKKFPRPIEDNWDI